MKLVFRPAARREMNLAITWFEKNTAYGSEFAEALAAALQRIGENPFQYAKSAAYRGPDEVRRGLVLRFNFVVVYRVLSDRVQVIAVHHTSRDWQYWLTRL